jgi:hypothetical protein
VLASSSRRPASSAAIVDVALNEAHLRKTALFGPDPGPLNRLRRAVDAYDVAIGSDQIGGNESHVPRPAAQIEHPHAGAFSKLPSASAARPRRCLARAR